jgi:integrase
MRRQGAYAASTQHQRERGPAYDNRWGLVFTDRNGRHLSPETVSQDFRRTAVAAPVPTLRLHDLRHLHATLLLQAGVAVKVVSERLGHRSTQVTLEIYAHVLAVHGRRGGAPLRRPRLRRSRRLDGVHDVVRGHPRAPSRTRPARNLRRQPCVNLSRRPPRGDH